MKEMSICFDRKWFGGLTFEQCLFEGVGQLSGLPGL